MNRESPCWPFKVKSTAVRPERRGGRHTACSPARSLFASSSSVSVSPSCSSSFFFSIQLSSKALYWHDCPKLTIQLEGFTLQSLSCCVSVRLPRNFHIPSFLSCCGLDSLFLWSLLSSLSLPSCLMSLHLPPSITSTSSSPLAHSGRSSSLYPQAQGISSTTIYLKRIGTGTRIHTVKWTGSESHRTAILHTQKNTAKSYMHAKFSRHMSGAKCKKNKQLHSVTLPSMCTNTDLCTLPVVFVLAGERCLVKLLHHFANTLSWVSQHGSQWYTWKKKGE